MHGLYPQEIVVMASGGEATDVTGYYVQAAHGRRGSGCGQELLEDSYGSFRCSSLLAQLIKASVAIYLAW